MIDKGTNLLDWFLENNLYLIPSVKNLPALLKKSKLQWTKEGKSNTWSISEDYFKVMTQSQLEFVMTAFPTECTAHYVLKALFVKIFGEQMAQEGRTPLEDYELYCKIYEWLKKQQANFNAVLLKFRVVVLHLGLRCGKYDREMFKKFLGNFWEKPYCALFSMSCNAKLREAKWGGGGGILDQWLDSKYFNQSTLINRYAEIFIKTKADMKEFESYFDMDKMVKMLLISNLLSGKETPELGNKISNSELGALRDRINLKILDTNSQKFAVDEPVELTLEIKNISEVEVRIFQIDTYNYCKTNLRDFNDDIDLEGLVAKFTSKKNFTAKPVVVQTEKFEFPDLDSKRGVFVIEFLGGGLRSRAIIWKGSLNVISTQVANGNEVLIVNEKKDVCKPKGSVWNKSQTGIFMGGKEFLADPVTGKIYLPFEESPNGCSHPCVVFHDNFAQTQFLFIGGEKLTFNGEFVYSAENIRSGKECTVLFRSKLFCNGNLISQKRITDTRITVESDSEGNRTFKDLKLSNSKDYEVKFMVPAKIDHIRLNFTGIAKRQDGKLEEFYVEKEISIDSFTNDN